MITVKKFYTKLKPEGLAIRKKKESTKKEISYLKKYLNKKQRILDLACGYGRLAIPLAKQGYNIKGVDITPIMIKKAKESAKKEKLKIEFKIGDMKNLPYKDNSFDAIICMWSVFIELTNKKEQLKSIKEILRVLSKNGFVLIDMPCPLNFRKSEKIIKYGKVGDEFIYNKKTRIVKSKIAGMEARPSYMQDKKTLSELMRKSKIKQYKIFVNKFGGRSRLFLQFWK
jgi:ubiquinone/menaquinone biosynthesis C-methylase UbiE